MIVIEARQTEVLSAEDDTPFKINLDLETRTVSEMENALFFLAQSVRDIVRACAANAERAGS